MDTLTHSRNWESNLGPFVSQSTSLPQLWLPTSLKDRVSIYKLMGSICFCQHRISDNSCYNQSQYGLIIIWENVKPVDVFGMVAVIHFKTAISFGLWTRLLRFLVLAKTLLSIRLSKESMSFGLMAAHSWETAWETEGPKFYSWPRLCLDVVWMSKGEAVACVLFVPSLSQTRLQRWLMTLGAKSWLFLGGKYTDSNNNAI